MSTIIRLLLVAAVVYGSYLLFEASQKPAVITGAAGGVMVGSK